MTVLADEATPVAELSRADAESRLTQAEAELNAAAAESEALREKAYGRVLAARAMRDAATAA